MSPQKDWFQNVALAERLVKHHSELPPGSKWTPEMDAHALSKAADKQGRTAWTKYPEFESSVRGRSWGEMKTPREKAMWIRAYDEATFGNTYREISPEGDILGHATTQSGNNATMVHQGWGSIEKAMRILDGDGSMAQISAELGGKHKVRNFFNNIYNPASARDATIDTHHVAGGLLMPYGSSAPEVGHALAGATQPKKGMPWDGRGSPETGTKASYGLYFDATADLGREMNRLPREMQSITWEQLRTLFPPSIKGNHPFVGEARDIWKMKDRGEITGSRARELIIERAQIASGGSLQPAWKNYSGIRGSIAKGAAAGTGLGLFGAGIASADDDASYLSNYSRNFKAE